MFSDVFSCIFSTGLRVNNVWLPTQIHIGGWWKFWLLTLASHVSVEGWFYPRCEHAFFNAFSPWANAPPPPPMILREWYHFVHGPSGIILAMLPEKKLGLTTNFGHFSKWPPQNLRFPISRKLLRVGSWFGGLNLYFLGQGIRWTHYTAWQTIIMCVKGWKTWKNPRWPTISYFILVNLS